MPKVTTTIAATQSSRRTVTVEVPPDLPPVSCDDAWLTAPRERLAHLFPVGRDMSLCGCFDRAGSGERATAISNDGYNNPPPNYRPYCTTCLAIQEYRWLSPARRVAKGGAA
jgi:hypothetical protein